jgi:hypothetical protein
MKKSLFVLLSTLLLSTNALALEWVRSSPPKSCAEVCSGSTVSSGKDKNGYRFYVCRGYAPNGELRPGFNIAPDSTRCFFEYGGSRGESKHFDCLCN